MIILSIGSDHHVFESKSAIKMRLIDQSSLFDEMHVIVASKNIPSNTIKISINDNKLNLYPVRSRFKLILLFKLLYVYFKTARYLKNSSRELYITSQDPFESGLISFFISKFFNIKLQIQIHTDCFNHLFIKHSLANYFRTLVARIIVPRASSIRVVSNRIKSSLLNMDNKLSSKIHTLPVWSDIDAIKNKEIIDNYDLHKRFSDFSKIILIVARLESEKNIELSIHAFQKMLRFDKDIGLVIAGSGSKEFWLKELVEYLGIDNNVKFLGWVTDVSSLYKTCDLLLVTSLYEGYGLNMVESVSCGTPIVSTDVGIAKDIGANIVPYDAGVIALKSIEILRQNNRVELPHGFMIGKSEYLDKFKNTFI